MISVFSPYITRRDMDLVLSRMVEDAVTEGVFNERFEKAVKEQFNLEYVIALRSPYNALQKALQACGLERGAKIAISALAPAWQKDALEDSGFTPIILDIDEKTFHPKPENILSANPSAIILFDALGRPPSEALLEITDMPIVEDISQTLGMVTVSSRKNLYGHFLIWSLEADSAIATGGGALLCANGKRDAQILRLLDESMPRELKMTDYNAALGVSQLKSYPNMIERRKAIYQRLAGQLLRTRHLYLQLEDPESCPVYAFPIFSETSVKEIIDYAMKHGVESEYAFASSIAKRISGSEPQEEVIFPTARSIAMRCILFPMHHKLTNQQVDQIGKVIATLP